MKTLKRMPFKAQKAVFQKLEEIASVANLPPEERAKYEQSLKVYRDQLVTMESATNKGLKQGREEGREEGRQEGRQEERLQIARNLKAAGASVEMIANATGLSPEEIEAL